MSGALLNTHALKNEHEKYPHVKWNGMESTKKGFERRTKQNI